MVLDETHFTTADFSSAEFLSVQQKFVPIEQLKSDLFEHLKRLKTALVELINADYAQFINLSTRLVGTDSMIDDIAKPLSDISVKVCFSCLFPLRQHPPRLSCATAQ